MTDENARGSDLAVRGPRSRAGDPFAVQVRVEGGDGGDRGTEPQVAGQSGAEEKDEPVLVVPRDEQEKVLAAVGGLLPSMPPEPVSLADELAIVQQHLKNTAARLNGLHRLYSDAVVRARNSTGERYRRQTTREVLSLDAAIREGTKQHVTLMERKRELAMLRGDDVGLDPRLSGRTAGEMQGRAEEDETTAELMRKKRKRKVSDVRRSTNEEIEEQKAIASGEIAEDEEEDDEEV